VEKPCSYDAGVTVVIVGIGSPQAGKRIYDGEQFHDAQNVAERRTALAEVPLMLKGNYYGLCKNIMFDRTAYEDLVRSGFSKKFLRKVYGSSELVSKNTRYCL